eukprot:4833106-Ditylum_brightwellii.AAC.1
MDVEWMPTYSLSPVHATSIDGAPTWVLTSQLLSCPFTTILIAIGGSSSKEDDVMIFGWKIILDDTTSVAHHAGPAFEQLKIYSSNLTVEHVKGHQDDDSPYDNLELPAQLNVDADQLAMQCHINNREILLDIPCLPINNAQLVHDIGVLTGHYFKNIQDIATEKALAEYIMYTNQWTQETYYWID